MVLTDLKAIPQAGSTNTVLNLSERETSQYETASKSIPLSILIGYTVCLC